MTADIRVVIPARFGSLRLPGKPLADLNGLPMIIRTARQAQKSGFPIIVAYDDEKIGDVLAQYDIPRMKTRTDHKNGTQRLSEVVIKQGWSNETLVVNVQGDEPLLPETLIRQVAFTLESHSEADVATLAADFNHDELASPNAVKVVRDKNGYALYFSRSLIPYMRDDVADANFAYLRHIGIYAYRVSLLKCYPNMEPTPLEQAEKLEQLRFLEHGYRIAVDVATDIPPAGVDSPEDLIRVSQILKSGNV